MLVQTPYVHKNNCIIKKRAVHCFRMEDHMKKKSLKQLLAASLTFAMLTGNAAAPNHANAAAQLNVSLKSITLTVGQKKTVKANMSVKFSVSNQKIVSLKKIKKKQCSVVAKKKGTCTITVKAKNQVKKIKVQVKNITTQGKNTNTPTPTLSAPPSQIPIPEPTWAVVPTIKPTSIPPTATPTASVSSEDFTMEGTVNKLGYTLLDSLENGENIILSPYSIMMAMTLLDNAADGITKQEMEAALGIKDLDTWNQEFHNYYKNKMNLQENDYDPILRTVNSIWKNDTSYSFDSDVQKSYFKNMTDLYGMEEHSMDFKTTNPQQQINAWVEKETEGMIKDLITSPIKENITNTLVNALYFDGNWSNPFYTNCTYEHKFYGKNGVTTVDMMSQSKEFMHYLEKDGLRVLEIPFRKNEIVMDVILAQDENISAITEFQKLSATEKNDLFLQIGNCKNSLVNLHLPKFKLTYGTKNIVEQLTQLGIKQAFNPYSAEFPLLRGNIPESIFASDVLHQAAIEVKESGVTAAAATAILMPATAVLEQEEVKPVNFTVDRPFVFTIRDKKTNMIYFLGQIEDLNATNQLN